MIIGGVWDSFLATELKGKQPLLSEPLIVHSSGGAVNEAAITYGSISPICILITWVNLEVPAGAGTFQIRDNLGRLMFQNGRNANLSGHYPFPWFVRGRYLRLLCNAADIVFSVGHHYVTVNEEKG